MIKSEIKKIEIKRLSGKCFNILIFLFSILYSLFSAVYGSFNDFGVGAKTIGLAGTYAAIGDDIYSPFHNPAGLSYLKRGQLAVEYGRLHLNLTDDSNLYNGFIGVAYPFIKENIVETQKVQPFVPQDKLRTIPQQVQVSESTTAVTEPSVTVTTVTTETSITRTLSSAVMLGYKTLSLAEFYSENTLQITYSRFLGEHLSAGITLKSLSKKFTIDRYLERSRVFDYGRRDGKTAYAFDVGAIINPIPQFYLGISALNINEPNMGFLNEDKVSAIYKIGLGVRKKDSKFGLDATYLNKSKYMEISCGTEKSFGIFDIRGGISYSERGKNSGMSQIAAGFSIRPTNSISIDYAINYPLSHLKNTYGSHWLSFIFKFGKIASEELEPGSLERAYKKLEEDKINLENKLSAVEREKRKLEEVLIEEATARMRERIKRAKEKESRLVEPKTPAQPKTETTAAKTVTATRMHIVKKGDTLQSLAEKYYNDSKLWIEIYNANKEDIGRGGTLKLNQVLVIPPLSSAAPSRPFGTPPPKPADVPSETRPPVIAPSPTVAPAPAMPKVEEVKIAPLIQSSTDTETISKEISKPLKAEPEKAKQLPSKSRIHTVKPGENLRIIAEKYYNNAEKWKDIFEANKNKIIRGQIRPGMELVIP